jgi:hypothetical protein
MGLTKFTRRYGRAIELHGRAKVELKMEKQRKNREELQSDDQCCPKSIYLQWGSKVSPSGPVTIL